MDASGATVVHHAKPRHAGVRAQAVELLVDSHERKQVVDPLFHRQRRIIERVTGLLARSGVSAGTNPKTRRQRRAAKCCLLIMATTSSAFSAKCPAWKFPARRVGYFKTQQGYHVHHLLLATIKPAIEKPRRHRNSQAMESGRALPARSCPDAAPESLPAHHRRLRSNG